MIPAPSDAVKIVLATLTLAWAIVLVTLVGIGMGAVLNWSVRWVLRTFGKRSSG